MRATISIIAMLLSACVAGVTHAGGPQMLDGLTKAYETRCGAVGLAVWYSPTSEVAHFRDDDPAVFDKYRIVIALTNLEAPADRAFTFTPPAPLGEFFTLYRAQDGAYADVTDIQIDPLHSGSSATQKLRFEAVGETYTTATVYPAFTTIAARDNLGRGDYLVRIKPYVMLETDGKSCTVQVPDLKIKVR